MAPPRKAPLRVNDVEGRRRAEVHGHCCARRAPAYGHCVRQPVHADLVRVRHFQRHPQLQLLMQNQRLPIKRRRQQPLPQASQRFNDTAQDGILKTVCAEAALLPELL